MHSFCCCFSLTLLHSLPHHFHCLLQWKLPGFLFSPLSSSPILFLLFKICVLSYFSQVLEACSAATDCGTGLYCGNCPALGKTQPFCVRGQATIPTSIVSFFFSFFFFCVVFGYGFELNCMHLLSFIYGLCEFGGGFEL